MLIVGKFRDRLLLGVIVLALRFFQRGGDAPCALLAGDLRVACLASCCVVLLS